MKRAVFFLAIALWSSFSASSNAQLGSGNIAVYRVGTGSAALNNASTATFLDVFDSSGNLLQTIAIDNTGANRLTNSGSATSEGALARSQNGLLLSFAGYDTDIGLTGVASSTAAAVPRVGGTIDGAGLYSRIGGTFGTQFSGNNIRSVVVNGANAWGVGGNSGVVSLVGGTATSVSTTPITNARVVNVIGDQLYFSTGSGTRGIYAVGTGTPTTGPQTATLVFSTGGTSASPYAFQASTNGNVVYIADDASIANNGGIQRWVFNGTSWSMTGVLATPSRGLTVDWSNPNNVVLYAITTTNSLIRFTDDGTTFSSTTTLATAGTNTAFRGVDQTLLPATWTRTTSGNWVETNTSTSGFGNQFANWSVGLADGVNLAFQNVDAGGAVTATNNSPLASASSIRFTGTGFGSGTTQYTLDGNALTLNGTAATVSGVTNNSTATQTVNLNLTLATPQSFNAAAGALTFGGSIDVGANALTVAGNFNTSLTGALVGSGSLTKTGTGTLAISGSTAGYTGAINVNGGRLQSAGTFTEIVVNSGGRVAPGVSPGTLNSTAATWNGGGVLEWEIDNATGAAGTNWDLWNVTGNDQFTFNATAGDQFVIDVADPQSVANFDPTSAYSWQFASFNGAIQGAGFDPNAFNVLFGSPFFGNGSFSVSQVGNGLFLNFAPTPVPEPAAMLLVGLAGGAWFFVRRRRFAA